MNSWDRRIDNARFQVLREFDDAAVLDRETGLVWERQPSTQTLAWPNARLSCAQKGVGGRGGWRLPAFNELSSLVDPAIQTGPQLPPGHPFLKVQSASYWSATRFAEEPGFVLVVSFQFVPATAGQVGVGDANIAGGPRYAWAVRGGAGGPGNY
ncbi:MAG: DUF1566 domain-containing protein [Acidobacteriota bacterium]